MNTNYVDDIFSFKRAETPEVKVGDIKIGGESRIAIQSMADTDTLDSDATVKQITRMVLNGAELVRVAVPSIKEAENLKNIKKGMIDLGIKVPLVADIHFNRSAAEIAVLYADKVRINPGNFYDKRAVFKELTYTNTQYQDELKEMQGQFEEFLELCSDNGTAVRVGVNQGSLSDRIMSRYGDTVFGIVESAMEFLRVCAKKNFKNVVVSIKSSNARTMIYAVRYLRSTMNKENISYPIHIGVTEAGEGADGRMISAVGCSTLLSDGLGDTIRVSLTESPEDELPFAKKIVDYYRNMGQHDKIEGPAFVSYEPFQYERRVSAGVSGLGDGSVPVVIQDGGDRSLVELQNYKMENNPDFILKDNLVIDQNGNNYPLIDMDHYLLNFYGGNGVKFVKIEASAFLIKANIYPEMFNKLRKDKSVVLIVESTNRNVMAELRALTLVLDSKNCQVPIIATTNCDENSYDDIVVKITADLALLLIDGRIDGIMINSQLQYSENVDLAFSLLQAARSRTSKAEFISCPGCGRTLYDLQQVAKDVKSVFKSQKHLKIGVMGCIVNGPGEMGDVDYGYVGSAPGKVNLYKGRVVVKKGISSELAIPELKKLIEDSGDWINY